MQETKHSIKDANTLVSLEMKRISRFILNERHKKKYSYSQLEEKTGLSKELLFTLETNKRQNISLKSLIIILSVFDIKISDYFKEEDKL